MGNNSSRPYYSDSEYYPKSRSSNRGNRDRGNRRDSGYEETEYPLDRRNSVRSTRSRQPNRDDRDYPRYSRSRSKPGKNRDNDNTQLIHTRPKSRGREDYSDPEPSRDTGKPEYAIRARSRPGRKPNYALVKHNKKDRREEVDSDSDGGYAKSTRSEGRRRRRQDEYTDDRYASGRYPIEVEEEDDGHVEGYGVKRSKSDAGRRKSGYRNGRGSRDYEDSYPEETSTRNRRSRGHQESEYNPDQSVTSDGRRASGYAIDPNRRSSRRESGYAIDPSARSDAGYRPRETARQSAQPAPQRRSQDPPRQSAPARRRQAQAPQKPAEQKIAGQYLKQGDQYLRQGQGYIRTGEGVAKGV